MSQSSTHEERCAAALKNLAAIHNQLARSDLNPDTRRDLEIRRENAKIHFQCLLQAIKTTSE